MAPRVSIRLPGQAVVDFQKLFPNDELPAENRVLELTELRKLKPAAVEEEEFIPSQLYVRQEMRRVWEELKHNDSKKGVKRQVLIGSPGVGKSVVMFLHALRRAYDGKKVLYFRKTTDEETISLFSMEKVNGMVRIRYNRTILIDNTIASIFVSAHVEAFPDLYKDIVYSSDPSHSKLEDRTGEMRRSHSVLMFVDGPRHTETEDTLKGTVEYLCTTGGHPYTLGETTFFKKLVIMGAWNRKAYGEALMHVKTDKAMENLRNWGFAKLVSDTPTIEDISIEREENSSNHPMDIDRIEELSADEDIVDLLFFYTGGRIREAVTIVTSPDASTTLKDYIREVDGKIASVNTDMAELAMESSECSSSAKSVDSFRSMFQTTNNRVFQIVDSQFLLRLVTQKIATSKYLNSFKRAVHENQRAIAGYHFEAMMHSVFCTRSHTLEDPVQESHKSTGNGKEGVLQLTSQSMYWIPSTPNFANIDAALIDANGIIFAIQYTVSKDHVFSPRNFRLKFLNRLPEEAGAIKDDDSVRLIFVIPSDVSFTLPDTDNFQSRVVRIDCESMASVESSATAIFERASVKV